MDVNTDPNLLPQQIFTTAAALLSAVDSKWLATPLRAFSNCLQDA